MYDSSLVVGLNEGVSKEFLQQATRNFMVDLSVLSLGESSHFPSQTTGDIVSGLFKEGIYYIPKSRFCIPKFNLQYF